MKVLLSTPYTTPLGWRARRQARRRLAELDALGARLAELSRIRDLAEAAREVVATGWVKDAWYVRPDARRVDLVQARRMARVPVERACLVGAILHAGGGVASADTQLAQRTLDLTCTPSTAAPTSPCAGARRRRSALSTCATWCGERPRAPHRADVEALLHSVGRAAARELHGPAPPARRPGIAPRRARLPGACRQSSFTATAGRKSCSGPRPRSRTPGRGRSHRRPRGEREPPRLEFVDRWMAGGAQLDGPGYPGFDAAGVVDEVGEGVTDVAVGDEVFGGGAGAQADFALLDTWARKPASVDWAVAAAATVAGEHRGGACGCWASRRATRCSSTAARAGSARSSCRWPRRSGCG